MTQEQGRYWSAEKWVQIAGLVIAVVATIITVFFSIRAERTKEVTVTFLATRPLVAVEGGRASAGLEVRLGNNRLEAPWLLAGRIENTGNLPIEERDIEAPAKLSFSRGKIVAAEIVQKSQPDISAKSSFLGKDVTIEHKLLNPGDWIAFDVLFDGQPEIPPYLSFRISGISEPKQRTVSVGEKRAFSALIQLPVPLTYLLLSITTLVGMTSACGALIGLGITIREGFRRSDKGRKAVDYSPYIDHLIQRQFMTSTALADGITPSSLPARVIYAAMGNDFEPKWLDQPGTLMSVISKSVPLPILQSVSLDADLAAKLLIRELKEKFRQVLANGISLFFPSGTSNPILKDILEVDVNSMSVDEFRERVRQLVANAVERAPEPIRTRRKLDFGSMIISILFLIIGVSIMLVSGGTWRTLLLG